MRTFLQSILVLLIALDVSCSFAQLITIPAGNTGSSTDRRPYGNFFGYERSAYIFTSSEIGAVGTITSLGLYVTGSSSPAASTPVKIYMKETPLSSFTASSFTSYSSTAKLVYSGNVLNTELVANNWLTKTLDSTFFYSGNANLMILVEANGGGGGIEGSTAKAFRYNTTSPASTYQYWYQDNSPPSGNGTVSTTTRANVQLNITPASSCSGVPTPGTLSAGVDSVCSGVGFSLSLNGQTSGVSGITYQWQKSNDGISFTNKPYNATGLSSSDSISSLTYYRVKVTCNGTDSAFSNVVSVSIKSAKNCYCIPIYTYGCTSGSTIDSVTTYNALKNISKKSTGCTSQNALGYNNYTATDTLKVYQTQTFNINIGISNYGGYPKAWIDWNQNGVFDTSEIVLQATSRISTGSSLTGQVTVPLSALSGATAMRVRNYESSSNFNACGSLSYGETEDYTVVVDPLPSCTNPPASGTISVVSNAVCIDSTTVLTAQNYDAGSSLQWQVSTDSLVWSDVANANNSFVTSQQVNINSILYYRLKVTCIDSSFSNVIKLYSKLCYCTPVMSYNCSSDDFINNFSFNTLSNQGSGCNGLPNNYISYDENQFTTTLVEGVNYQVSLTAGSGSGTHGAGVWIDFNNNGSFADTGEFFLISNTILPNGLADTTITIPTGTALGKINMRVRYIYSTTVTQANACSSNGFGETEDYVVTIIQPAPCTNPPAAGTISANSTSVCANTTTNLTASNYDYGASLQWQVSTDSSTWSDVVNATNGYLTSQAVTAPIFYRLKVVCSDSSFSNVLKLNTKLCYCASNSTSSSDTKIDSVFFGSIITGTPASTCESYTDYTSLSTTIQKLNQYNLKVRNGGCGGAHYAANLAAYIDWNQDGDFDDADEKVYTYGQTTAFNSIPVGVVSVPTSALPGATTMRIVLREGSTLANSCGTYGYGETEDYTVVVDTTTPICTTPTIGGTISGPDTADANTTGLFVLNGYTGDNISWEISTNPAGPYTVLGVNNDSLSLYLNAVGTYYGRAKVSTNGCVPSYSDTFSITIILKGDEACDPFVGTLGQNGPYDFTLYTASLNEVRPAGDTCEGVMSWCDQDILQSIWIKFQAPASGRAYFRAPGTDTRLALWDAADCASLSDSTLGGFTLLGANDDDPNYLSAGAEMFSAFIDTVECLVPNKFYYIQLVAYPGFGPVYDTTSLFIYEAPAKDPSFVGLQAIYCEDAGAETLYPATPGGAFTGAGITPNNEFNPSIAGAGGPYTITYTLNGCYSFSDTVLVSAVPDIANVLIDSVKCKGDLTGSIAITMASGTAPFVFQWNSGQTDSALTNLPAGQYVATITSADGCVGYSASYSITEPTNALSADISASNDVKCFGDASGSSTVTPQGGTPGYTYIWSNGTVTSTATNLTAGVYTVTVTDANGCTVNLQDTLDQPASALTATSVSTDQVGSTNGSITLTVSGGSPIYQYTWSNNAVSQNITDVAGTYTVTITDANNCTFVLTDTINFISGIEGAYSGVRKISLYPNPTAGDATLLVELENEKPISVEVFDALGKLVLEQKNASAKQEVMHLDLKDFAAGLYSVRVKIEGSSYTKQLAIQR